MVVEVALKCCLGHKNRLVAKNRRGGEKRVVVVVVVLEGRLGPKKWA